MRATKYNSATTTKILMFIKEGMTVKNSCALVGISEVTLARWRQRFPDFNTRYLEAVEKQWQNLRNLRACGVRTYRRNPEKLRRRAEKQLQLQEKDRRERALIKSGKPLTFGGLRIRYGNIADDEPFVPCVNPSSGLVEYLKRKGEGYIQLAIPIDVFRRMNPTWFKSLAKNTITLHGGGRE